MSWKRLESATIDPNLSEGLEARIADPLWMLARQWQTGEFKGDDAANPLLVRLKAHSVRIERLVLPGGQTIELDDVQTPLEPLVEREPIRNGPGGHRVAAELGRLLIRSLYRVRTPRAFIEKLRSQFPIKLPPDNGFDPTGRRRLELLARGGLQGIALGASLAVEPELIDQLLDDLGIADSTRRRVVTVVDSWKQVATRLFSEPESFTTWDPERMEYHFELETTGSDGADIKLTTTDGYAGGRLDWYTFDRAESGAGSISKGKTILHRAEVLPAPLRFRGMPAARFWEFEEGDVYLGGIEAAPEDLARVAVATYGVIYGDDWMIMPIQIPHGTLTQITEITVLDDFGRRSTIPATAVVDGGSDRRAFKFFELTGDSNPRHHKAPLLFLPPTVETSDAGRPLEDVRFMRDEMANVGWAVEQRIESVAGRPVDMMARRGSAAELPPAGSDIVDDAWSFVLSTPVPDHWVPLIPVRLTEEKGSGATTGTIMFQRGRIPVIGNPDTTRGAVGSILMPQRRLIIHEEEIPRAGIRVVRRFQSARDANGHLHTWVGRRKGHGRGEGKSGLVFDNLNRTPQKDVDTDNK